MRPDHGWLPFGGGVRGCPGGKFSFEEATIALVCMYQRFRFELEPGQVRNLDQKESRTACSAQTYNRTDIFDLRLGVHCMDACYLCRGQLAQSMT